MENTLPVQNIKDYLYELMEFDTENDFDIYVEANDEMCGLITQRIALDVSFFLLRRAPVCGSLIDSLPSLMTQIENRLNSEYSHKFTNFNKTSKW